MKSGDMFLRRTGVIKGHMAAMGWDSSRYVFVDRTTKDGLMGLVADGDSVLVLLEEEGDVLVVTPRGIGWMYASALYMNLLYESVQS